MVTPDISVVIPCRNGADTLPRQLDALMGQETCTPFEIIVADNGSTDATAELVADYCARDPRIRLVDAHSARGANHARNCGVRAARGRWILFCDADDVVDGDWVEAFREALAAGADIVGGPLRRVDADGNVLTVINQLISFHNSLPWPPGGNCGLSREVYTEIGPMDEDYRHGDETEFFWRAQLAGYTVTFVPTARISYVQRSTSHGSVRQSYRWGISEVRLHRNFPGQSELTASARDLCALAVAGLLICLPSRRRQAFERIGRNAGRLHAKWWPRLTAP